MSAALYIILLSWQPLSQAQDLFLSSRVGSDTQALAPTVTLRGGVEMPLIGLGSTGACHADPDGSEQDCSSFQAIKLAMQNGYRAFHDALSYGNQAGLGAAIKNSSLPRKDLFVMSMVPKYLMGYNETRASVQASLEQLQVDYIDLVMVHHRAGAAAEWPRKVHSMKAFPDNWAAPGSPVNNASDGTALWQPPACAGRDATWLTCQDETWKALTQLKAEGKIRAIGVSNWMLPNLQRMADLGQELPAVNQIEQHIGWWDDDMLGWCSKHGVIIQAATPLARSHPAIMKPGVEPTITALAKKYNKSQSQVALRFLLEKGIAAIPSTKTSAYQQENIDVFDFKLAQEEVIALGGIALQCRDCDNCYKCWGDPAALMCRNSSTGSMFHCP